MNPLIPVRAAAACLVAAPALEVLEQVLSPLTGRSTAADMAAIEHHQGAFLTSVLIGIVATALLVPAFAGLGSACLGRTPRLARAGTGIVVLSMMGFFAVRMAQGMQLQLVRNHVDRHTAATLVDDLAGNPLGGTILAAFLVGSIVGLVLLAVATWRTGMPRPAAVALAIFPFADLALQGHVGTIAAHLLLLGATSWFAVALLRTPLGVPAPGPDRRTHADR
jgi:hypothetical protein